MKSTESPDLIDLMQGFGVLLGLGFFVYCWVATGSLFSAAGLFLLLSIPAGFIIGIAAFLFAVGWALLFVPTRER